MENKDVFEVRRLLAQNREIIAELVQDQKDSLVRLEKIVNGGRINEKTERNICICIMTLIVLCVLSAAFLGIYKLANLI